jgi:hypothetical protein
MTSQEQSAIPQPQPTIPVPKEVEQLGNLLGQLYVQSSELVLYCVDITDEDIKGKPTLKSLKEVCLDVARTVREIMSLTRKTKR